MHEMALAEGILEIVLGAAGGRRVRRIQLQVGRLRMVVPESLRFSYQLAAEGTNAAEALIDIEEVPALLRCRECGRETELDRPPFNCMSCSSSDLDVLSGEQILVDVVELEDGTAINRRLSAQDPKIAEKLLFRGHQNRGYADR